MNRQELIEKVSSKAEITKVEAAKVVGATLDSIIEGLEADAVRGVAGVDANENGVGIHHGFVLLSFVGRSVLWCIQAVPL